jgi:hypothetical protein
MTKFILIISLISLTAASSVSAQTQVSKDFKESTSIGSPEKFLDDAIEYLEYRQKKAVINKFPNSAGSFDSFGEILDLNSKLNLSLISQKKAIDLSTQQQNPQLDQFTQNLHKTKQKIK